MIININGIEDTKQLAEKIAKYVMPGTVILLNGDLGAGKTTFSQFFGSALGVTQNITSPTFNIIKSYDGRMPFHHMDCYRLEGAEDDLGFDEYFYGDGVTIVEWPEMIEDFLPESYLTLQIKRVDEMSREVTLNAIGAEANKLKEQIENEITAH
ncbi:tRNA (adenosine(37)-N6)-threonylcarbamoyltransferase complex ATPase subunit type 1 TsaE [Macrococcus armenti]|uniref:tRNA threonylcarbamoyladenosine biosynthesis protein TsaE n=1 Tax=Macrococcus armenti TaxID=2875764 RepID=A0ABY3ZWL4_9STAP|nr:tRNA (adenosine(37)-N6)-threonylcarbamoyltransferase complex ATPase subunit type 1 TsaE [Macrococcus armenti]UBH15125.1 tRNA (adenosine(37)-N6)-threonylcarbamoyltransferase complex ATPase subunit type 1 TsaE [Macrococcus armenti]UBH17486.1 tRNA (adenosine(37)-N6)-threonylcarbamoyltransferase complex ATPase subunit type 1 TsaE [Macrococcus armenti]UBH19750.1 tRNA (adenosine(37)-N6)-threonylcarbamoyltransferase complex ATPase subunit type 1 TsaE [Macrococcus armenti]UOB20261.1 tRNA (adenosine(